MSDIRRMGRRTACLTILGCAGSSALARLAQAQQQPPRTRRLVAARSAGLPKFDNASFYGPDGKFKEDAAKQAYLDLCRFHRYPTYAKVQKELAVTDFGLGHFTEAGLAYVVWVNDKDASYASLEVFLLPGQMIPEHWHEPIEAEGIKTKMESWIVRYGKTFTYGAGEPTPNPSAKIPQIQVPFVTVKKEVPLGPGEVSSVSTLKERHWQIAGPEGCIFTEVSTFHAGAAVKFTDPAIKF